MTENTSTSTRKPAPSPKVEYDFVKKAKGLRNSPAFCRVPGQLPPIGKMEHELKQLQNELKKKSLVELKDMLISTKKIATNEILLRKLPDRGAKVKQKQEILESIIESREGEKDLARALANLHLPDTDAMEWKTKAAVMKPTETTMDMDKTLKVLAEGALPSKELDEDDINPTSSHPYFTHKVQVLDTVQRKDRFVPVAALHSSDLVAAKKAFPEPKSKALSDNKRTPAVKTEAIPLPKYTSAATKQLSLEESLEIQRQQAEKLREITVRQAAARLAASSSKPRITLNSESAVAEPPSVQHIVDTRWRDTTEKGEGDSDDELDGGEGREREEERNLAAQLLDSDDDED